MPTSGAKSGALEVRPNPLFSLIVMLGLSFHEPAIADLGFGIPQARLAEGLGHRRKIVARLALAGGRVHGGFEFDGEAVGDAVGGEDQGRVVLPLRPEIPVQPEAELAGLVLGVAVPRVLVEEVDQELLLSGVSSEEL